MESLSSSSPFNIPTLLPSFSIPSMEMDSILPSSPATSLLSATLFLLLVVVLVVKKHRANSPKLPPGPRGWPVVGNLMQVLLAGKSFIHYVHDLRRAHGPIFTLRMGSRTVIVVSSAELAYEAFIKKGQIFASRPAESPTRDVFSCRKLTVNSAEYGPEWRSLRRNMVSGMLSAPRLREFRPVRQAAMDRLVSRLRKEAEANAGAVWVLKNARFAVFSILLTLCFGLDLDEDTIVAVEEMMKKVVLAVHPRIDDYLPFLAPFFRKQQKAALRVRQQQIDVVVPLIRRRRRSLLVPRDGQNPISYSYLDSLLDLRVEDRSSTLSDPELVTLCSEFLNGGTDTTATALEWAFARLVEDPRMQGRIHEEVLSVTGGGLRKVDEGDIEKMPYLQAFVKEVLRRHPPVHFSLSHAVTEAATLGGYDVPVGAYVEFHLEGISGDAALWREPEAFRPGRLVDGGEEADMSGVAGVRMIPFGAGRRMCPGMGMAMVHIPLTVARLVQEFEWGEHPSRPVADFSYKYEFTVVISPPLRALLRPRSRS